MSWLRELGWKISRVFGVRPKLTTGSGVVMLPAGATYRVTVVGGGASANELHDNH